MTSVNVTTTKNTVTVNGETRVVTVKTQGPQGPAFADGDIGDIVISGGGTVATIDNGVVNNAKIASNAAIDLTKLATGALPTAITVTSANISDLSIVDADISGSAAIAGTKISPNFGSQNITTSGTIETTGNQISVSGASPNITFTDNDQNPDYKIIINNGRLEIQNPDDNNIVKMSVRAADTRIHNTLKALSNLDVTGIITATGSIYANGNIIGDNNTNISGIKNITLNGTVDGRDVAADGTKLDGIEANAINASNTAITNKLPLAGGTITGNLTVGGNFTVNGTTTTIDTTTLTVEDKNIELGKVSTPTDTTADQGGITLLGATNKTFQWLDATDSWTSSEHIALGDNKKLRLGASQDLELYHSGTQSIITNSTGSLIIQNTSSTSILSLKVHSNNRALVARPEAATELYFDDSKKLETTSSGIDVDGSVTANDIITAGALLHEGDTDTLIHFSATDTIDLKTSGTERLRINNSGVSLFSTLFTNGRTISLGDSGSATDDRITFGESQDLQIYHSGNFSHINDLIGSGLVINTDNMFFNTRLSEQLAKFNNNGSVELFFDNVKRFETGSTGANVTGNFGVNTTSPASVLHIKSFNPDLHIENTGGGTGQLRVGHFTNGAFIGTYNDDGGGSDNVRLGTHSGDTRLLITSDGNIQIPNDNAKLQIGASQDLEIYHDGSNSYIEDAGTGSLVLKSNHLVTNAANYSFMNLASSETLIYGIENGAVNLYFDNSKKLETTSAGVAVTGKITTTGNIESNADASEFRCGANGDFRISHSGSENILRSDFPFFFRNMANNETLANFNVNGSVELYYDNSKKFETTSTGVSVTGDATISGGQLTLGAADTASGHLNAFELMTFNIDSDNDDTNRYFGFYKNGNSGSGTELVRITEDGHLQIPNDNAKLQIGAGQDFSIKYNGSTAELRDNTTSGGQIMIMSDSIEMRPNTNGGERYLVAGMNGAVDLYYDNSRKLNTAGFGVKITGDLDVEDADPKIYLSATSGTDYYFHNDAGTFKLRDEASSNAVRYQLGGDGIHYIYGNTNVMGTSDLTVVGGDLKLTADNAKLQLGASQDLQIYHDASNSILQNATGALLLQSNDLKLGNYNLSDVYFRGQADNAAELYFDNSKKFETATFGNILTGDIAFNRPNVTVGDTSAGQASTGTPNRFVFNNHYSSGYSDASLKLYLFNLGTTRQGFTSGPQFDLQYHSSGNNTNSRHSFFVQNTKLLDIYLDSLRIPDNKKLQLGTGNDLQIFHDGINTFMDNSTGIFLIRNTNAEIRIRPVGPQGGTNEESAIFKPNGAVELYYDNSKKLETTSTGIHSLGQLTTVSNVGIGTTSPNINNGYNTLTINSTSNGGVLAFSQNDSRKGLIYTESTGDLKIQTESGRDMHFATGGSTDRLTITSTGTVQISGHATVHGLNLGRGANSVSGNTVFGESALDAAVTGGNNTAIGKSALGANTSGQKNTAVGHRSLRLNTTGVNNVAVGKQALDENTTGSENTAVGGFALNNSTTGDINVAVGYNAMTSNTTGSQNTSVGVESMKANTTGDLNAAFGYHSLHSNTSGDRNTAIGRVSLHQNTEGSYNTAVGHNALNKNTTASNNTAVGYQALNANTTGTNNVAVGANALDANTTASNNTAVGFSALTTNTTGGSNTCIGRMALQLNETGDENTAVGAGALQRNTTADHNTAVGKNALGNNTTGADNVAVGEAALQSSTTGSNLTAVGRNALFANTTGTNNSAFGHKALDANTTGTHNTAIGDQALTDSTEGTENVAVGHASLFENTTGDNNTAVGTESLRNNLTADNNTAVGHSALKANTTGEKNVAVGAFTLDANVTHQRNTAVGYNSLSANVTNDNTALGAETMPSSTSAYDNVAIGSETLQDLTTGINNVAVGRIALGDNTTGANNTALGYLTLRNVTTTGGNTAVGSSALSGCTGNNNVGVGKGAGSNLTSGGENVILGAFAQPSSATVDFEVTLGSTNISTIRCNTQTISSLSDARDKTNVIDLPEGLDFITKLRPVKFEWATRDGNGKDGSFEHGFIAQDLQAAQKENDADYLNMVMDENPDRLEASYGKLVPILVKAIQELTMEVNKLKSNG